MSVVAHADTLTTKALRIWRVAGAFAIPYPTDKVNAEARPAELAS